MTLLKKPCLCFFWSAYLFLLLLFVLVPNTISNYLRPFLKLIAFNLESVQIIDLLDTQTLYSGSNRNESLLSSVYSGLSTINELSISVWIKKVSWSANWDIYVRFSNNVS